MYLNYLIWKTVLLEFELDDNCMNKFKKIIRNKYPGLYLLLKVTKRVLKRDTYYVQKSLSMKLGTQYIEIVHNGNIDYRATLYVISEHSGVDGFCATIKFLMYHIIFAEQHGFVPVVRFTKDYSYFDSTMVGNPFEYYFEAVNSEYDIDKALNVCYSDYSYIMTLDEYYGVDSYEAHNYNDENILALCTPIVKKYLKLKPEIVSEAEAFLDENRKSGSKILGVHYRGTDFKKGYYKHPVMVDDKQLINELKKTVETNRFDAIFIATDDASIIDCICESITDFSVINYPDVFRSNGDVSVAFCESDRNKHHYRLGYEIARDMYTLSLCDGLLAGKSSVGYMSNIYKHSRGESYEYMNIIDNGNNNDPNNKY